jgi:hypothetical protein
LEAADGASPADAVEFQSRAALYNLISGHFEKGITDIQRIDGGGAVVGGLALDPVGDQLAALLGDLDHRAGELEGIGKVGLWGLWGVCLAHAWVTGAFLSFHLAALALEA